ncbi:putative fiber protein [Roseobacter phage CRP-13]|nr:putative fiber protein [Roseobacter phage CRP-13]
MPYIGNQPAPQNVTSTEITDGTITNVDIASNAAIDVSKLNGVTATATELNYNDITTLGTVEASKVVTANADGNVTFPDSEVLRFGNTADLQIYHSGSNSIIADTGTGNLKLLAENFSVQDPNQTEQMILATPNGSVNLYYDGNKKIETTSVGADVTGEFIADSYNETYAAVTSTTNATTVNCEQGNSFSHVLTEATTFTFSNPPASGTSYTMSIEIIQDASASGYTVTWPASVDWPAATAPTLTATASAKDIFVFTTRDGGTNWYGFTAGQALA